jgi:fatty-acyl-CoA synthase
MYYEYPLTIGKLLSQTLYRKSENEVVYGNTRYTWTEFYERVKKLASGLESMGVKKGWKVAVVDFDTHRYLEAYYAVPMMGAVLHTVNIRLPFEQLVYTMSHAEDDVVLIRDEFLPLAAKIAPSVKTVKGLVTMSDDGSAPAVPFPNTRYYEDLLSSSSSKYEFPELDENTRATLFYTSGTTGMPKGVWFTHRQIVLHTMSVAIGFANSASPVRLDSNDVVMPLVPFFHVHCWGIPYVAGALGQKLVLAGKYDPAKLLELVDTEKVTFSSMVPTILNMVVNHPLAEKYREALSKWKITVGGSALPRSLADKARQLGISVMSGYGLSETAPVLTLGTPLGNLSALRGDELLERVLLKAGVPIHLVELRVVDSNMKDVPRDNRTMGEIVVRAPWAAQEYYKDESMTAQLWSGDWLHTGDLAVMDESGYIRILDRVKDTIKSGGEWISSIQLEDLLMRFPGVVEAAVIRAKHPDWEERPVAIVHPKEGVQLSEEQLREHLMKFVSQGVIAKFWVPDRFIIQQEPLPKTTTGKIDKKPLKEKYTNLLLQAQG